MQPTSETGAESGRAADLLASLIRCPSVTPAEAGTLAFLEGVLQTAGFTVERMTFSAEGTPDVENLFATIGGAGPHLAFAGHADVVPPGDAGRWHHAPFSGAVADGMVWGRGAVDMKGAIAAFLAAAEARLGEGPLPGRLSFLITGDEEGPSVNGTVKLLAWAAARGHRFDAAIVGEPTNRAVLGDTIKVGRRGSLSGTLTVAGRQGHVAYPELADNPVPHLVRLATALIAEPLDAGTERFQPTNLELTSVDVGNPAFNVIPAAASARFNIRFNDRWSFASLEAWLRDRLDRASAGRPYELAFQPMTSDVFLTRSEMLIATLSGAIGEVTGLVPELTTGGGTSDARFVKNYCPVVEFGLVGATMHAVDERVPLADLARLTAIYRRFLDRYYGQAA